MSQVKRNILANFVGRGWYALLSLALVPLYIRFMGIEAYGLVGFFATLQALFNLLDLGLTATMNREMARYAVQPDKAQEARDLVRTLEVGYWAMGIVIGIVVLVLSPFIAHDWINAEKLAPTAVQQAVMMMGLAIAFQWPISFYAGGLMGLQRQVLLNVVNTGVATLRGAGAILILWLLSPTIQAFFGWQLFTSALQTLLTAFYLWRSLPQTDQKSRFRKQLLRKVWHFAASMSATSLVILILGQLDRVVLSKILPLGLFGYYNLAKSASNVVITPMAPITQALLPRLCQLAARNNEAELQQLYHRICQLISLVLFPTACVLALFSSEILFLWTGDLAIASEVHWIMSLLAFGVALHYSVMGTLDLLQMAYGWLKPSLYSRSAALLGLGPLMVFMAVRYGATGAAIAWLVIYTGYVLITPHLVFRRLLRGEKWRWYFNDLGLPLGVAFATAWLWHVFIPVPVLRPAILLYLGAVLLTTLLAVAASMVYTRQLIRNMAWKLTRLRLLPDFN